MLGGLPGVMVSTLDSESSKLELDPLPLLDDLLETLHPALKEKKHLPLAIY
jgi:hypothetical protein